MENIKVGLTFVSGLQLTFDIELEKKLVKTYTTFSEPSLKKVCDLKPKIFRRIFSLWFVIAQPWDDFLCSKASTHKI